MFESLEDNITTEQQSVLGSSKKSSQFPTPTSDTIRNQWAIADQTKQNRSPDQDSDQVNGTKRFDDEEREELVQEYRLTSRSELLAVQWNSVIVQMPWKTRNCRSSSCTSFEVKPQNGPLLGRIRRKCESKSKVGRKRKVVISPAISDGEALNLFENLMYRQQTRTTYKMAAWTLTKTFGSLIMTLEDILAIVCGPKPVAPKGVQGMKTFFYEFDTLLGALKNLGETGRQHLVSLTLKKYHRIR